MKNKIKHILFKKRNLTPIERDVIKRALPAYRIVLSQYEKYTDERKKRDLELLNKTIDGDNAFNFGNRLKKFEPTLEETKEFVYSAWADAVVQALIPMYSSGQQRRAFRRKIFREVSEGKYINKEVRETIEEFIEILK